MKTSFVKFNDFFKNNFKKIKQYVFKAVNVVNLTEKTTRHRQKLTPKLLKDTYFQILMFYHDYWNIVLTEEITLERK